MAGIEDELRKYIGSISEEEKAEVHKSIREGSNPSRDFFIMLIIASIIATVGLLTNSVAVIIGAMLVSPLLTPVIGISLGAVMGDFGLFRRAIEAEAKGVALVLALVIVLALLIPSAAITSEILLRTHPTPLDLLVALASGAAAAYALSRKNIGAALPGVAIAVAVLPPLCVVGIGFALRRMDVAAGGALTFIANIVAINFAASAIFWLMNFSPKWSLSTVKDVKGKLKTSAVLLLVISLPLAYLMWDSLSSSDTRSKIEQVLVSQMDGIDQAKLTGVEFSYGKGGELLVFASMDSPKPITNDKAGEMKVALEKKLGAKVELVLRVNMIELVRS